MGAPTPSRLPDAARERVAALDSEGYSAGAIAKKLHEEFGIAKTRNAIIGVINRMGLRANREARSPRWHVSPKGETVARGERKKQSRVSNNHVGGRDLRPAPVAAPVAPVEPPPVGGVGLIDLQHHHCRAILGRGSDGLAVFCGAPKSSGSYCADHGRMFYAPAPRRLEVVE